MALIFLHFQTQASDSDYTRTIQLSRRNPAMTRRATDNSKALGAFLVAKSEIDSMLARLAALSDDHFDTHPDEIDWGHVGTLNHYRDRLREITDCAFNEGEFAE